MTTADPQCPIPVARTPISDIEVLECHPSRPGPNAYRFSFNGMEKEDELHGSTGTGYDFGARLYDPRVGKWWSIDALVQKYPEQSPYSYTFNNPVFYYDYKGDEGVAVVDKEAKTITLKAIFYVQTEPLPGRDDLAFSSSEVQAMQENTNNLLNAGANVLSTGEYAGYTVLFDLEFREGGPSFLAEHKSEEDQLGGYPIGNTLGVGDEKSHPFAFRWERDENGLLYTQAGVTQRRKNVVLHTKYGKNAKVMAHEALHVLFFDRDESGEGVGADLGVDVKPPTQEDIDMLINNPQLPKVQSDEE